ncbi:tripartite tricarboxylate transporter TctB family protein [Aurantimonas sp. VKM B-3413]|uniref:tripartite tricarboxylate transporter TctB family protein n=1 Tax=Aurantimonas sp. VKM B-3413 TaxID=2779401 RepID=UPI001E601DE5|nr:tripartite tricarboxylate transporter TctB family protein [Aurantimonas sp. VKM B-3413]MCB8840397.1 hypothetical protein [Aurantimonas sp. VKM B-3413]
MTHVRSSRFLISAGFTLVGVVFLVAAFAGGGAGSGNLAAGDTPDALPRILLFAWVGLGLADLVRQLFAGRGRAEVADGGVAGETAQSGVLGVMALALLLAVAIVFAGYLVPVLVVLPLLLYATGTRSPFAFLLSFLVLGPGLWFLFQHVLEIRLPSLLPGGLL